MAFEQVTGFLTTHWYVPLIFLACIIYTIIMISVVKKKSLNYAKDHPDVVKVHLMGKGAGVMAEPVSVHRVDNEKPNRFMDGMKTGVYLLPGKHTVDMEYSYTRAGVIHKTVTKSTGVVPKQLTVERGKEYKLTYDLENKEFIFSEIQTS